MNIKKLIFTAIVATSLDGFIARTSHANSHMDWTSQEDWDFFQDKLSDMDAVIVWRHTFEVAEVRLRKRHTYVLTRESAEIRREGTVTWINPDIYDIANILICDLHQNIAILGGRKIYTWALEHQYCDELFLTIEPIILGSGIRFLGTLSEQRLLLQDKKVLNSKGSLLLHYKILWSPHL